MSIKNIFNDFDHQKLNKGRKIINEKRLINKRNTLAKKKIRDKRIVNFNTINFNTVNCVKNINPIINNITINNPTIVQSSTHDHAISNDRAINDDITNPLYTFGIYDNDKDYNDKYGKIYKGFDTNKNILNKNYSLDMQKDMIKNNMICPYCLKIFDNGDGTEIHKGRMHKDERKTEQMNKKRAWIQNHLNRKNRKMVKFY